MNSEDSHSKLIQCMQEFDFPSNKRAIDLFQSFDEESFFRKYASKKTYDSSGVVLTKIPTEPSRLNQSVVKLMKIGSSMSKKNRKSLTLYNSCKEKVGKRVIKIRKKRKKTADTYLKVTLQLNITVRDSVGRSRINEYALISLGNKIYENIITQRMYVIDTIPKFKNDQEFAELKQCVKVLQKIKRIPNSLTCFVEVIDDFSSDIIYVVHPYIKLRPVFPLGKLITKNGMAFLALSKNHKKWMEKSDFYVIRRYISRFIDLLRFFQKRDCFLGRGEIEDIFLTQDSLEIKVVGLRGSETYFEKDFEEINVKRVGKLLYYLIYGEKLEKKIDKFFAKNQIPKDLLEILETSLKKTNSSLSELKQILYVKKKKKRKKGLSVTDELFGIEKILNKIV